MSRILFLSQLLPYPLDTGPKVRAYYVLRHLATKHRVTLLAFTRSDDTLEAIQHLREFCEEVHVVLMRRSLARNLTALAVSLLMGEPFIIRRDYVLEMAKTVDRLLQIGQFDAVHADQLWMAQYALRAEEVVTGVRLVLDEHNACFRISQRLAAGEHNLLKRLLWEREWRKLRAYESRVCAGFDHVITVTQQDQDILQDMTRSYKRKNTGQPSTTGDKSFTTIPICVDTRAVKPVKHTPRSLDVLHLGTMFWLPNVEGMLWFARRVWPKVIAQVSQARLVIAGKNPPAEVQALANGHFGSFPIRVTGYVPDARPYLEQAAVFIVPLLSGGGMRVKIVDAWRWGLPVVSTSIGAEGIEYRHGENILIADTEDSFADAVVQILKNPDLDHRLRTNGRNWVEQKYEWSTRYAAWDSIYPSSKTSI